MCGIVGYTGGKNAVRVLLDTLSNLEYRGYDSAGISVFGDNGIETVKAKGRLQNLADLLAHEHAKLSGHCGIGHTRWATHGEPSDLNAHPHATEKLSLVHNGIIENYQQLKASLTAQGYTFVSRTDTEVAAKLIDSLYRGIRLPLLSKRRNFWRVLMRSVSCSPIIQAKFLPRVRAAR